MSHTKGKLETRGFYAVNERGRAVFDCGPVPMREKEIEANARRLVACWNACEEIPLEQLECDQTTFVRMLMERQTLKQERDALKAENERLRWLVTRTWVQEQAEFRLGLKETDYEDEYLSELHKAILAKQSAAMKETK